MARLCQLLAVQKLVSWHKGADAFPVVIRSCTDGAFCDNSVSAAAKIPSRATSGAAYMTAG